jgi:hypothetical protein
MKTVGWVLLVAGIVMLLVRSFNYTTKEKVVDAGPIEISKKETHTVVWPYYAGGILAVTGLVLVLVGPRRRD